MSDKVAEFYDWVKREFGDEHARVIVLFLTGVFIMLALATFPFWIGLALFWAVTELTERDR